MTPPLPTCRRAVPSLPSAALRFPLLAMMLAAAPTLRASSDPDLIFALLAEQSRTAFTVQGSGARATGTGGAFIAVADDATAVSYNPAGLAQLLKPEFSAVGQFLQRGEKLANFRSVDTTLGDSRSSENRSTPEFVSFALPWKHNGLNYVVQASVQRIFDFGLRTEHNAPARVNGVPEQHLQKLDQRGGVNLWSLAFGAELSPRILVGGSVNLWRGSWAFASEAERFDGAGGLMSDLYFNQDNAFRGFNWSLGTIWRSEYLNVGLVYRSAFMADYSSTNTLTEEFYGPTPSASTTHFPTDTFSIQWPETFGAGLGFHPHPRWLVTADWTRVRWSGTRIKAPGTPYDGLNFFDLQAESRTPDTHDFRAGTEWIAYIGDRLVIPVRAGAFREPQPLVDRQTGQQRVFNGWTFGFGIKSGGFTVDLAYKQSDSIRQVSRIQLAGNGTSFVSGSEDLDEKRFLVSLIWQLDPEGVRKALSWFFVGR